MEDSGAYKRSRRSSLQEMKDEIMSKKEMLGLFVNFGILFVLLCMLWVLLRSMNSI